MGVRQVVAQPPAMFLAVITDNRDNCAVEVQETKEKLYRTISEAADMGDIEGLEYESVEELNVTIYEVINKPWQVSLGRSKVTIAEKSE